MSNMSIENIGTWVNSGGMSGSEQVLERGRLNPSDPLPLAGDSDSTSSSFAQVLKDGMEKVNQAQNEADHGVKELLAGRAKNIHETMLLLEKADMTFKMAMQVRNKIIDAYREVMKMQV